MEAPVTPCTHIEANRGFLSDEIMFHELVHAHRGSLRIASDTPLGGGLIRYGNQEEFLAIVMSNIYISARAKSESNLAHWREKNTKLPDPRQEKPFTPNLVGGLKSFASELAQEALSVLQK
jgi:hypothetical protein